VQPAGEFDGGIGIAIRSIAEHVFDDAAAFDPGDDLFNNPADTGNEPIVFFFLQRQLATARFFLGLMDTTESVNNFV
jgi:hypothetical protein